MLLYPLLSVPEELAQPDESVLVQELPLGVRRAFFMLRRTRMTRTTKAPTMTKGPMIPDESCCWNAGIQPMTIRIIATGKAAS